VSSISPAAASSSQTSSSVDRSGLSVDDVVTAKIQPILDQIDSINSSISSNQSKISAYEDMQQILINLLNATDALRDPLSNDADVFDSRSASLTSSNGSDADNALSADIDAGTATGDHTVTVTQLASAERIGSAAQSSRTTALNMTGSFTLGESGKSAGTINVTADMSLNDIAAAINKQAGSTGVSATVITVSGNNGNPQYMLVLSGADTNQNIALSTTSGNVLASLGITGADGTTAANVLQEAKPAILTVDGIPGIERDTNDIDDVIDGVTLHLTQADPNNKITLKIQNDTSKVKDAINLFVDSYNAWRSFVAQNQATQTDGTASSSAVLFGDSTLRSVATQIDTALTSFVDGSALGAIGIKLNADNNLEVDDTKLDAALSGNYDQIKKLFQYSADTSSTDLVLSNHGNSTYAGSFTLDVTTDDAGNVTSASARDAAGNVIDFKVSNNVISAPPGSVYEGLQFVFSGTSSESISVTTSQGIADRIYQISDAASDTTSGSIQNIVSNLETQDTNLQAKASSLQARADDYQTYLLDRYGRLESSISQANQLQDILKQLMDYDTAN
jgi:flagellar hook-associated protein 2